MSISDESIVDSSSEEETTSKRRRLTKVSVANKASVAPIVLDIDNSDDSEDDVIITRKTKANARKIYCIDIDDESSDCESDNIQPRTKGVSISTTGPFGSSVGKHEEHCIDINDDSSEKDSAGTSASSGDEKQWGPFGKSCYNSSCSKEEFCSPPTILASSTDHPQTILLESSSSESESDDNSTNGADTISSPPGALQQLLAVNYRRKSTLPKHPNLAYPGSTSAIITASLRPTASSLAYVPTPTTAVPTAATSSSTLAAVATGTSGDRSRGGSRNIVTEDPSLQQWRRCLWPGLSPFYRVILRAKCVYDNEPIERELSNNKRRRHDQHVAVSHTMPSHATSRGTPKDTGDLHLEWGEFWDKSSLQKVGTEFTR